MSCTVRLVLFCKYKGVVILPNLPVFVVSGAIGGVTDGKVNEQDADRQEDERMFTSNGWTDRHEDGWTGERSSGRIDGKIN